MMRNGRGARRTALFVIIPLVSALASLVALPAVSMRFGADGWSAIAVGMAVGMAASVLVELGWQVNGPVRAARAAGSSAGRLYALAGTTKALAFLPAAVLAAGVSAALSPAYPVAAGLAGVAGTALGLSPAWFFIGRGSPGLVLAVDVLPRVLAAASAAGIILLGGSLSVYPIALTCAAVASVVLGAVAIGLRPADWGGVTRRRLAHSIRSQSVALRGQVASALYIALPIVLVSIVAPNAVAVFSAAERLQRMTLTVLKSLPNSMVNAVAAAPTWGERESRTLRAIVVNGLIGGVAGSAFALGAPWATQIVFAGVVELPTGLGVLCGVVILLASLTRAVGGIGLVVYGRVDALSSSAVWGAAVGIPGILGFGRLFGAPGGFIGEIVAECAVLIRQTWTLVKEFRRRRRLAT